MWFRSDRQQGEIRCWSFLGCRGFIFADLFLELFDIFHDQCWEVGLKVMRKGSLNSRHFFIYSFPQINNSYSFSTTLWAWKMTEKKYMLFVFKLPTCWTLWPYFKWPKPISELSHFFLIENWRSQKQEPKTMLNFL